MTLLRAVTHQLKCRKFTANFHNTVRLCKRDAYEILGLQKTCASSDIKKAYYGLAKKYHPDTNKSADAKEKFVEIQQAYDILSDESKRAAYDQYGHAAFGNGEGVGAGGFPSGFEGFGNFTGFEDIFSSIFGANMRGPGSYERVVNVDVSFMEAAKGVRRNVNAQIVVKCGECGGSGTAGKKTKCTNCGGSGSVYFSQGGFHMQTTCRQCHGKGTSGPQCKKCGGSGENVEYKNIQVDIPAGVEDGMELSGNGVRIRVKVEKSREFERRGSNIHVTAKVPFTTAILGGTVKVPTIDGDVELKIAPGTQPGEVQVMRGRGMPRVDSLKRGDQYVQVKVVLPTKLSSQQKELLKQFENNSNIN